MSLSVMLVSSCEDNMDTIKRGLLTSGIRKIQTVKCQDDFNAVRSTGSKFDIAVIHIGSDFDGDLKLFSFIREALPKTECIVVSSTNDADLAKECISRGAYDYLTMPLNKDNFASRIREAVKYKVYVEGRPRILILEDDPVSGKLMEKYLGPIGDCTLVTDGLSAITEFERVVKNGDIYHLLFLDIMVPEIHGKDVLIRVREIEEEHGIPRDRRSRILMTSALSDTANVVESFKGKCDAYLVKPIDRKNLIREITDLGFNPDVAHPR